MNHRLVRALTSVICVLAAARALVACGDMAASGATSPEADAGTDAATSGCRRADDCPDHNDLCVFDSPTATNGRCAPPVDEGRCTPDSTGSVVGTSQCYPGARCEPVPANLSALGGLCSFHAPAAPLFTSGITLPKISLSSPDGFTTLRAEDGVQLRWVPPAVPADAIMVAAVLRAPPQRAQGANRVANAGDVVWLWSSQDPGTAAQPGTVALEAGWRVGSAGQPTARFGTNVLAEGRYWWFVYAIRAGTVVATSDVLSFTVGALADGGACVLVDQCVAQMPGELPDTVACIQGQCRRRCASDLDCPGLGARCDLQTTVRTELSTPRRGGYCTR